ncbi:MAG: SOS response-associated peptidase [Rhodobacteraceae bacterium]|nr:SOS response-associated peptidase [Paracoccaceae bacterium]
MCGRFVITLPDDAMAQLFDAVPANDLPSVPNFNVCPTNRVHAVRVEEGHRRLVAMRWGFLPHWYKNETDGPLLINARADSIADKPAFRSAVRERRCLIPASGFYEWTRDADGRRLPWYIRPADGDTIAFAGIWQDWTPKGGGDRVTGCAIVTTETNRALAHIHHRMPVTIAAADWPLWLGEAGKGAAALMQPAPEETFVAHRVAPRVNSNRARGADLIEPVSS